MVRHSRQWALAHRLWLFIIVSLLAAAGGATYGLWPAGDSVKPVVKGEHFTNAASPKADFTLSVSPSSRTVVRGIGASYTVTMSPSNGYKGPVTLSATVQSGSNATAAFTPATVNSKSPSSTLTVSTTTANAGTWSISITGTDGSLTHSASASVTVQPQPNSQKFTLDATPPSAQVLPGDMAQYTVNVARNTGYTSAISIGVTGLPSGATPTFTPASPISGSSSTLQVNTSSSTPNGTYSLQISASGANASTQTKSVQLVVTDKGKPFSITGSLSGTLAPGGGVPINLTLTNPNNQTINITNLTVSVTGTSAGSDCGPSNFAVQQFNGTYPIVLAKGATRTLQQLGVSQANWPVITMLNDAVHSQDACKNAQLLLSYTGAGQG